MLFVNKNISLGNCQKNIVHQQMNYVFVFVYKKCNIVADPGFGAKNYFPRFFAIKANNIIHIKEEFLQICSGTLICKPGAYLGPQKLLHF